MLRSLYCVTIALCAIRPAFAQPAQVMLIRHAEKPNEGNGLSLKGKERAAALAPYFLGTETVLKFGVPVAIFAQAKKHETSSVRPIETVKPLAKALGLSLNDSYERDDYKNMVKEIMRTTDFKGHSVLICWEHNVIPKIAAEFGASNAPDEWDKDVFDRTWIITFKPNQASAFENLPQQLLFHDSKQ